MKRTTAILLVFAALLASACDSEPRGQNGETNESLGTTCRAFYVKTRPEFAPASVPPVEQETEQRYWITTRSGVRHNSSCRYYHNSNGRPCGPNEGRACRICGG